MSYYFRRFHYFKRSTLDVRKIAMLHSLKEGYHYILVGPMSNFNYRVKSEATTAFSLLERFLSIMAYRSHKTFHAITTCKRFNALICTVWCYTNWRHVAEGLWPPNCCLNLIGNYEFSLFGFLSQGWLLKNQESFGIYLKANSYICGLAVCIWMVV